MNAADQWLVSPSRGEEAIAHAIAQPTHSRSVAAVGSDRLDLEVDGALHALRPDGHGSHVFEGLGVWAVGRLAFEQASACMSAAA